jgi:N-methylhydantoinase A
MTLVCGIDTGGTFTDCVLLSDEQIEVRHAKVPSTPDDFTRGVQSALRTLAAEAGTSVEELVTGIDYFFHGTTIATNIMVQRSGATTGLLTTAGFRDIIFIQRGIGRVTGVPPEEVTRISATAKPVPIVAKGLIGEVAERIDCRGDVVVRFNEQSCRDAVAGLLQQDIEAIGICFLWSFRNDSHEVMAERIVREMAPDVLVTRSSAIAPKWGEYERISTVAINAYVGPATRRYLNELEQSLKQLGLRRPMLVMTAPGGVVSATDAATMAVATIGSGPTGGIIGATALAEHVGWENVIATDMGGTSFEVGLIVDGEPTRLTTSIISKYEYYIPSVAVHSIGAGGGSIAWLDATGRLRVGPRSAGAAPGPACYGRGGIEPTVTDAELLLGYLSEEWPLAGTLQLDRAAAERAMAAIARPLGMTIQEAASGVTKICEFAMADLIRKHTVQQGRDPRDFVLLAYGGSGPAHAGVFAAELEIERVVVPAGDLASVWSAFGVAEANVLHVLEHTELIGEPLPLERFRSGFAELEQRARRQLAADGIDDRAMSFSLSVDMRYRAQVHVVAVDVSSVDIADGDGTALIDRFEEKYELLYGRGAGLRDATVEVMTLRLRARGEVGQVSVFGRSVNRQAMLTPVGERRVFWPILGKEVDTPIYRGKGFRSGERLEGPAVVELPNTTVVVQPGHLMDVDDIGNFVLTLPRTDPLTVPAMVETGGSTEAARERSAS